MISNPDLILYACIARTTTVLAEFSRSSDLGTLARRCIEKSPPYHAVYNHTVRRRTYTLLIADPIVLFAITDDLLSQTECLKFLGRLRSALAEKATIPASKRRPEGWLQPEFDSVVRELMATEAPTPSSVSSTPSLSSGGSVSRAQSLGFTPLLGAKLCKGLNLNLKKKRRHSGEPNGGDNHSKDSSSGAGAAEDAVELFEDGPSKAMGSSNGGDRQRTAKQVWKKHVWIVLVLDLFVCVVLFGIWLWVCRGFKCIEN